MRQYRTLLSIIILLGFFFFFYGYVGLKFNGGSLTSQSVIAKSFAQFVEHYEPYGLGIFLEHKQRFQII